MQLPNEFQKKRAGDGTREWSEVSVNIQIGCPHGCLYCYARYNALHRFKQIKSVEEWQTPRYREKVITKGWKKREGVIMFPTQHDITQENLAVYCGVLGKILKAGNHVLIVSKPDPMCIEEICMRFDQYRDQILFRFTIGTDNEEVLEVWEPGAPCLDDRIRSLDIAHTRGYQTSVAAEPLLGGCMVAEGLLNICLPYVTETFWFGFMNNPEQRVIPVPDGSRSLVRWIRRRINSEVALHCSVLAAMHSHVRFKKSVRNLLEASIKQHSQWFQQLGR